MTNKKLWDWIAKNQGLKWKMVKNYWVFYAIKKFYFFVCMYKMVQISKEGYKKCEVEIIYKGRYFWVNRKDLELESDVANSAQIFDKFDPGKEKYRQELTPNAEYQQCRVFVRNNLVERKIKSCRKSSKTSLELKKS